MISCLSADVSAGLRGRHGEGICGPAQQWQGWFDLFWDWLSWWPALISYLLFRCAPSVWTWWCRRRTRQSAGSASCPPAITSSVCPASESGAAPETSTTRSSSKNPTGPGQGSGTRVRDWVSVYWGETKTDGVSWDLIGALLCFTLVRILPWVKEQI